MMEFTAFKITTLFIVHTNTNYCFINPPTGKLIIKLMHKCSLLIARCMHVGMYYVLDHESSINCTCEFYIIIIINNKS